MVSHTGNGGVGLNSRSKTNFNYAANHYDINQHTVHRLMWTVFLYLFAILNWCFYIVRAIQAGTFFQSPTEKEENAFAIAKDAFWNLSKQPIPGFRHKFFKTRTGFQFHYLTNDSQPNKEKDLIFFIHGFPNSCMVWRHLLQEPTCPTSNAIIIAVDLPGYGGSDSIEKYDTTVLEHLTEFIVAMREHYDAGGDSIGNTLIVGHDWGCVISLRLAAEAPCLADRFILSNGPLIELVKANIERSVKSSWSIFRQFQASPRKNFGCLAKSFQTIKPLLLQTICSGYIFVFQLPSFFVRATGGGGNLSFLRAVYRAEHSGSRDEFKLHESKAAHLGPGAAECKSQTKNGETYGPSVAQRVRSPGEVFWQNTAYYRDGLGAGPWEKSIETIAALYNLDSELSASESPSRRRSSSASAALFNNHVKGSLYAPVTMLWGEKDLALTKAMCLDGIGDYLGRDSEVFLLPNGGHWLPVDTDSRKAMAQIIGIFANGSSTQIPPYIAKQVQGLDVGASLIAKR